MILAGTSPLRAQKKPLDHSVYDGWQSVSAIQLSPDGRLLSYEIKPQEGDGTLYLKDLSTGAELSVPRGTGLKWAQDATAGLFTVKAPFADTRQAKIDKKKPDEQPKDSVARIDLRSFAWPQEQESAGHQSGGRHHRHAEERVRLRGLPFRRPARRGDGERGKGLALARRGDPL